MNSSKPVEIVFPVYDDFDNEYKVKATYVPQLPHEIEVWQAIGPAGEVLDGDEIADLFPRVEEFAWDALYKHYGR